MRIFLCGLIGLVLTAHPAIAAAPVLNGLYPSGAQRGTTTAVTAIGSFEPWPVEVWLSRSDVTVTPGEKAGELSVAVADDATPGICWIRLYGTDGASAVRPFLIGRIPEINETEPNNQLSEGQDAPRPSVIVNGRFEKAGDVDIFRCELQKGQTLVASLESNQRLAAPVDGVLQIVSAKGFVLDQNDDDHGLDPQIAFTAPETGVYFVRCFSFPEKTNSTIGLAGGADFIYRLTLTTEGFLDFAYPLAVENNAPETVRAIGWNLPQESLVPQRPADIVNQFEPLAVVGGDGIANDILLGFVPHVSLVEEEGAADGTPQLLPVPATITGCISTPNETDRYQFAATKGTAISFRAEADSLGIDLDPVIIVVDATGKELQRLDDVGKDRDPVVTFRAAADGSYEVRVTDLHRRGSQRLAYRLTAEIPSPDFALSVAADVFSVTPGKPLEIPVTIDRQTGFAEEISVSIEGLPEGVTAEAVTSAAKGDTAKTVKLVVNATAEPMTFPVRISGKAGEQARIARTAAGIQTRQPVDLWLTVLKKP